MEIPSAPLLCVEARKPTARAITQGKIVQNYASEALWEENKANFE